MTDVVYIVLAGLIVAGLAGSALTKSWRTERQSIDHYEEVLHRLGDLQSRANPPQSESVEPPSVMGAVHPIKSESPQSESPPVPPIHGPMVLPARSRFYASSADRLAAAGRVHPPAPKSHAPAAPRATPSDRPARPDPEQPAVPPLSAREPASEPPVHQGIPELVSRHSRGENVGPEEVHSPAPPLVFGDDLLSGPLPVIDPLLERPGRGLALGTKSAVISRSRPATRSLTGRGGGGRHMHRPARRTRSGGASNRTLAATAIVGFGLVVVVALLLSNTLFPSTGPVPVKQRSGQSPGPVISRPTPTTAPGPLTATSSNSFGSSYSVPASSFEVTLSASGPCWVETGPSSGGPYTYVSTLTDGQQHTAVASGGSLWIRLGDPVNVSVTISGPGLSSRTVDVPAQPGQPFNLTFSDQ